MNSRPILDCTSPLYWAVPSARYVHVGQAPTPQGTQQQGSQQPSVPHVPGVPSVAVATDEDGKISIFWRNLLIASFVGGVVGGAAWAIGSGVVNTLFFPKR